MRRFFSRWLLVLLWMGVIFLFSSQPNLPRIGSAPLQLILSKTAHFLEYLVLTALLLWAQKPRSKNPGYTRRAYLIAFMISVAYAISDEFHQSLVPNRRGLLTDVGIDALGAAAAILVSGLSRRTKEAEEEQEDQNSGSSRH